MLRSIRSVIALICAPFFCSAIWFSSVAFSAEPGSAWRAEWEKTVKAAEEEGTLVIYMTQAFEPVFRDGFQKKFPKIKVTTATGEDLSSANGS